jgi:hypothetical protein
MRQHLILEYVLVLVHFHKKERGLNAPKISRYELTL